MDHSAVAKAMSERDPHGRWLKGHKAPELAGRLPRSVDQAYLDVMLGECNLEEWKEICHIAVQDAKSESIASRRYAREWLGRIIMPAIERIMVAAVSVNLDAGDGQAMMRRLVQMLSLDAHDDAIDGESVDITATDSDSI